MIHHLMMNPKMNAHKLQGKMRTVIFCCKYSVVFDRFIYFLSILIYFLCLFLSFRRPIPKMNVRKSLTVRSSLPLSPQPRLPMCLPKSLPLIYKEVAGNFIIIASKGGAPAHPLWYRNLEANPECEIQVASRHFNARMRVAEGAQRSDLWAQLAAIYPPYDAYQETAGDREIPVVVLEPQS